MRIAIDARHVSNPQRGGYKTYTRQLLSVLGEFDRVNEYWVYFDRPYDGGREFPFENFTFRVSPSFGNPLGSLWREQWGLWRTCRRDCVELLHCTGNSGPAVPCVPLVLTVHDAIHYLPQRHEWQQNGNTPGMKARLNVGYERAITPLAAAHALKVVTPSHQAKRDLMEFLGLDAGSIEVIPLAVDARFAPATEDEGLRERLARRFGLKGRYALCMGSVDVRKNIPLCLKAFGGTPPAGLALAVVSSHPAATSLLRDKAKTLGTTAAVILEDVTDAELVDLYNAAEVFIFPSLYEGFGLPPLEAMACGTPVIAARTSSLPEVLGDGACYIDTGDADALRAAVERIVGDAGVRDSLREKGLARTRLYTRERQARDMIRIYQSAERECARGRVHQAEH